MKIMITGITGQVGHALKEKLVDYDLISVSRGECNLLDPEKIKKIIDQYRPDLIINPAAFTNVDQAEDRKDLAFQINRDAPKIIAMKAYEYGIPFIHFSTDYVFDGRKEGGYIEEDTPMPLGVYGKSKLAGENAIKDIGGMYYIFRTSWVYSTMRENFYLSMKHLSAREENIKVVEDQLGVPTSNIFIAEQIKKIIPLLKKNNVGIYHLIPDGFCSWYEFAQAIIIKSNPQYDLKYLERIKSHDYSSNTKRPLNSFLVNEKVKKTFMLKFDDWKIELNKVMDEA